MIKTLIAIGLTTLCGFTGLRMDNPTGIELTGKKVTQYLMNNNVSFLNMDEMMNSEWVSDTEYTIYYCYQINNIGNNNEFLYRQNINEIGMLLKPKSNVEKNQVKLLFPNKVIFNLQYSSGSYYNNYILADGTSINYAISDYEPIGLVFNPNILAYANVINETWLLKFEWQSQSPQVPPSTWYPFSEMQYRANLYKIKQAKIDGELSPFANGSDTCYTTTALQNPVNENVASEIGYILNTPFIMEGFYFDALTKYGISIKITGEEKYRNEYFYLYCRNRNTSTVNTTRILVNERKENEQGQYIAGNVWTYPNGNTYTLLMADYISTINGQNITQEDSVRNSAKAGTTVIIEQSTDVLNIFEILGQAFSGFGTFFSVSILPGITIGLIVTIPLLIGIILWLINMFKRH